MHMHRLQFGLLFLVSALAVSLASLWAISVADRADAGGAATWTVTTLDDPGDGTCDASCSLQDAILSANGDTGNTVAFNVPGCPDTCTIFLQDTLPTVSATGTLIDGQSQPGWIDQPIIVIDGSLASVGAGLSVTGDSVTVRGLVIQNMDASGVSFQATGQRLEYSIIRDNAADGVSTDGDNAMITGNVIHNNGHGSSGRGINAAGGDPEASLRVSENTITSNEGSGIAAYGLGPQIHDNTIRDNGGDGITTAFGNGTQGAEISGNTITGNGERGMFLSGSKSAIMDNVVSENGFAGIYANSAVKTLSSSISGNTVTENGMTSPDDGIVVAGWNVFVQGNTVLDNPRHGIAVYYGSAMIGTHVGGETGNVISGNGGAGIIVEEFIPRRIAGAGGPQTTEVWISGNSLSDNGGLGIDIGFQGVTENDDGDVDLGSNRRQNFPVLSAADGEDSSIAGSLNSQPETPFRIEFFSSPECDPSGNGEGMTYLGYGDFSTDVDGNADFEVDVEVEFGEDLVPGSWITSTATNFTTSDTSEFSDCVEVTGNATPTPEPTVTPGPTATATPEPTATPTPQPSPTGTPGTNGLQGDVDCDEDVDSVDALKDLRHVAALTVEQTEPCTDIGSSLARIGAAGKLTQMGDVDCDEDVDSVDALKILRHVAALPVSQTEPCRDIGE